VKSAEKLVGFSSLLWLVVATPALLGQPSSNGERVRVIIGFNRQPGPAEQALVRNAGGVVRHTFRIIPAIAAELPAQAIRALENHPWVSVIEPDVPVRAIGEYETSWGIVKIGAQTVHNSGNKGTGVKVCVIDSGIDTNHPDLFQNYKGGWDFVNNDSDPSDDNGHGTHVAGIVAAALNNAGVVGVAPEAWIYAYKVLDKNGSGSFSNVIAALDACVSNAGPGAITNNSYGSSTDPGTLVKAAFDNAYNNYGILHVAAAGNATGWTCNQVSYPARYDSVIAVGATNSSDQIASWSCRGPEVELSAPGVSITSTYPDNTYATMSGTSMASPHVAGAAALVIAGSPVDQNADGIVNQVDVRLCLQRTALDLGAAGRDTAYGYGRVQVDSAVSACQTPPPPETPPAAPTNLTVTSTGRNYVSLAWQDNSTNETNFELERCQGSGCTNFSLIATVPANTTTYKDSGLARRTTYSYRVRARNSAGASDYSNIVTATTK
jgi:subtilisin